MIKLRLAGTQQYPQQRHTQLLKTAVPQCPFTGRIAATTRRRCGRAGATPTRGVLCGTQLPVKCEGGVFVLCACLFFTMACVFFERIMHNTTDHNSPPNSPSAIHHHHHHHFHHHELTHPPPTHPPTTHHVPIYREGFIALLSRSWTRWSDAF
jgi:hypothetical protein